MKNRLLFRRFFASLLLLAVSMLSWAYDFEVDGIYYNRNSDGTVVVTYKTLFDGLYSGSVVIPSSVTYGDNVYSVTSIGAWAFYECSGLTSVTIPNSVTSIGSYAFSGCTSLPVIDNIRYADTYLLEAVDKTQSTYKIKEGTRFIGKSAFYLCWPMTSITLPASVESIGWGAFEGCSGLTSVTIGNGVTSIGDGAFKSCGGLTSVTIPNSVTSIGEAAFYQCSGLTSVTIPNSVTSIGYEAFSGCTSLPVIDDIRYADTYLLEAVDETQSTYKIKEGTRFIDYNAFSGCSSLKSINIPASVINIGTNWGRGLHAFYHCPSLEYISVDSNNKVFDSRNGCNAIVETASNILIAGCKNTVIPNSVTSIGRYAFHYCSGLTSINIPENVANIGGEAFFGCSALTSVTIPNSVTSIGNYAFLSCSGLTSVTIGNGVKSIGEGAFYDCSGLTKAEFGSVKSLCEIKFGSEDSNPLFYAKHLYIDGTEVKDIVIPESVMTIGSYAFRNCSGLTSIDIPSSVTSIGGSVFSGCSGLTSVTIPESVTSMGSNAFSGCDNLMEVTVNSPYVGNFASTFGSQVKKYTLDGNVFQVGGYAFNGCTDLTTVVVGNGVEWINSKAFGGCAELNSVTLGEKVRWIGDNAFQGCCSLKSVNIPESVTDIGVNAFGGCDNLPVTNGIRYADTYLVDVLDRNQSGYSIKSGTRFIGSSAFNGCTEMTTIYIPESVETIETGAFALCSGLTALDVPEGVWSIEDNAFSGCSGLASVTLPASMRRIDKDAFQDCTNLKKVTCLVKESDRRTEDLPVVPEPVKPLPGVEPSSITEYFYPFNPAHPDDPTLGNVDETTDVTIDNVYPADECKAKWLDYYKKVYNNRTATSKTNTKWTSLSHNPYIKRNEDEVVLLSVYSGEWEQYPQNYADYEAYIEYMKYTTVPVPETARNTFEEVPLSDATLYVYEDVIDAYRVTSPWSKFGQILPIDPLAVEEVKSGETAVPDENAPIYDLMGRRLQQKPASGYYIQGGKKYFVK